MIKPNSEIDENDERAVGRRGANQKDQHDENRLQILHSEMSNSQSGSLTPKENEEERSSQVRMGKFSPGGVGRGERAVEKRKGLLIGVCIDPEESISVK